jgi:hypothetical protein
MENRQIDPEIKASSGRVFAKLDAFNWCPYVIEQNDISDSLNDMKRLRLVRMSMWSYVAFLAQNDEHFMKYVFLIGLGAEPYALPDIFSR